MLIKLCFTWKHVRWVFIIFEYDLFNHKFIFFIIRKGYI